MTPQKTLLCIVSLFIVLGILAAVYPDDGIQIGNTTLRFPKLTEVFAKDETADTTAGAKADAVNADPEAAIKEMMEATKRKEFAAYSDSLKYFEDFFKEGRTRFDLPNNDPTWFDRFFLNLQMASVDSSVVHIVHYGDSQLEEDRISSALREDFQAEFGGAGPGLMPPVLTVASMTTNHWNSGNLKRYISFGPKEEQAIHNRYGMLAQFADLSGSATIGFKKRKDRKETFAHVGGYSTIRLLASARGNLKVKLQYEQAYLDTVGTNDDGTLKIKNKTRMVAADAPDVEKFTKLAVYTWNLPDTTSSVKLNLSGRAEIYGISADGAYGVAVDNVAMRGSSGTIFSRIDNDLLAESYKVMNAKLIIMEYGGNMVPSVNANTNIERLKGLIARQIQAIQKANPNADILFIGPADMAKQMHGSWQTYPGLAPTIEALREVALENGLAYWDMHRVMGGNKSMIKWVRQSPPLGFTDHVHFTRKGASYMGDLFCSALRMHYDYFKFRDRHGLNDKKLEELRKYVASQWKNRAAEMHMADSANTDKQVEKVKPTEKAKTIETAKPVEKVKQDESAKVQAPKTQDVAPKAPAQAEAKPAAEAQAKSPAKVTKTVKAKTKKNRTRRKSKGGKR